MNNDKTLIVNYVIGGKAQRSAGLDIIRCFAILFVIASHFFLHTGFNSAPFTGVSMFIQGMGQTLFLINVPLFLILTGYLNINKTVSRKYYKGCVRVLVSYLVFSVLTVLFRRYYMGEQLSVTQWILKITDFSAIPYGWYVEMWIGLFLLTPFLNILWRGVESQRHRRVLIVTLYLLTALPDFFNRYGVHLVPGYWEALYPVTFFYIGAYIREYRPSPVSWKLWVAIVALCMVNPLFNAVAMNGHTMIHLIGDGNGVVGVPLAALFFTAFYRVNVSNRLAGGLLARISVLSLDMYLCSYMFDMLYYSFFKSRFFESQPQFGLFFFVIVPAVFVSSFLLSLLKQQLGRLLTSVSEKALSRK